jgi:hypothetical protein
MEECSQLTPTISYSFNRHRLIDFLLKFYEMVSYRIFLNRSLVGHVFLFTRSNPKLSVISVAVR